MDFMNDELYRAVSEGKEDLLRNAVEGLGPLDFALYLTPRGNTALHIAVTFEQEEIAQRIINTSPSVVSQPNYKGDTPLHVSARAGHLRLSKLLTNVGTRSDVEQGPSRPPTSKGSEVWKVRNSEGNTAVHEAIKNRHGEVSLYLLGLDKNHELALVLNNDGESLLYSAAEAGLENVVSTIMEGQDYSIEGPDGQNPLHVAVIRARLGIVNILLRHSGRINVKQVDRFGKTALHYAATLGYGDTFTKIVSKAPSLLYISDNHGNFPLHIAAIRDYPYKWIKMVMNILCLHPCAAELVDRKGRNFLHLAVMNNNLFMLRNLMNRPVSKVMINEFDHDGNTPLHLAIKNLDFYIVDELLKHGADLRVTNKDGLTALDVCEFDGRFSFQKVYILRTLISHGAARARLVCGTKMPNLRNPMLNPNVDLKSLAKILSVVSTLVATVTFAAAFTLPGGYKNNDPNEGAPVFMRKAALKAFVLSDTIAFCCSISVAINMIWALMGDRNYLNAAVFFSIIFSIIAVSGMVVAFVMGLYVVISDQSLWLAIVILCVGVGWIIPFFMYPNWMYSYLQPRMLLSYLQILVSI